MDDVVPGHLGRRIVHHHAFENPVRAEDEVHHTREIHHLGARLVGGGDEPAGRMRRIDQVHALAVFDLGAGHADLFQDFVGRRADGGLVHQIAAGPEAAAQREGLFDEQGAEPHGRQVLGADQAGRTGADDDDVAFDELVEFLVIGPRNLPSNIALSQWSGFGYFHDGSLLVES